MTVRVRLHRVLGRRVVDRDGVKLGRVVDVRASRDDDELRVDALLVGTRAVLARIMQTRATRSSDGRGDVDSDAVVVVVIVAFAWYVVELRDRAPAGRTKLPRFDRFGEELDRAETEQPRRA